MSVNSATHVARAGQFSMARGVRQGCPASGFLFNRVCFTGEKTRHAHRTAQWPAGHLARHVTARVVGGLEGGPKFCV